MKYLIELQYFYTNKPNLNILCILPPSIYQLNSLWTLFISWKNFMNIISDVFWA